MANQALTLEQFMGIVGQPQSAAPAGPAAQPFTVEELQQIVPAVPQRAAPPSPYRTQGLGGPGLDIPSTMATAGRFLQGVGRGASMGLSDFPAAGVLMGTRALTGGAPMSFPEAIREVRQQQQAASEAGPAYTLGSLTGGLTTGGVLGVGRTALGTTGRMGAMGAIGGALPESPEQIVSPTGAAVGGTVGGLMGGATGAMSALGRRAEPYARETYRTNQAAAAAKYTAEALAKDPKLIDKARQQLINNRMDELNKMGPGPARQKLEVMKRERDIINSMSPDEILERVAVRRPNYDEELRAYNEARRAGKRATRPEAYEPGIPGLNINEEAFNKIVTRNQRTRNIAEESNRELQSLAKSLGFSGVRTAEQARDIAMSALPGMTLGALGGTAAAIFSGQPQNIPFYAMSGAGLGGAGYAQRAIGQAGKELGTAALARFPGMAFAPATTTAGLTGALTPDLAELAARQPYDYNMLLGPR